MSALEAIRAAGLHDPRHDRGELRAELRTDREGTGASLTLRESGGPEPAGHYHWTLTPPTDHRIRLETPSLFSQAVNRVAGVRPLPAVYFGPPDDRMNAFLLTDAVRDLATELAAKVSMFSLARGSLEVLEYQEVGPGPTADRPATESLPSQVALLEAVIDRWASRFAALESLGLVPAGPGEWAGTIEGVPVRVVETRRYSAYTTTVYATLAQPLPPDTCLEKKRKTREARNRHRIGDLLLDMVLEGRSSDMAATHARVAHEPVRARLLGLLGSWPGSYLGSEEVVLRLPSAVVDDCEVPAVVALCRALHP
ncbi:MAG: hypothetical protein R3F61_30940 [Myxococcota bacterium]